MPLLSGRAVLAVFVVLLLAVVGLRREDVYLAKSKHQPPRLPLTMGSTIMQSSVDVVPSKRSAVEEDGRCLQVVVILLAWKPYLLAGQVEVLATAAAEYVQQHRRAQQLPSNCAAAPLLRFVFLCPFQEDATDVERYLVHRAGRDAATEFFRHPLSAGASRVSLLTGRYFWQATHAYLGQPRKHGLHDGRHRVFVMALDPTRATLCGWPLGVKDALPTETLLLAAAPLSMGQNSKVWLAFADTLMFINAPNFAGEMMSVKKSQRMVGSRREVFFSHFAAGSASTMAALASEVVAHLASTAGHAVGLSIETLMTDAVRTLRKRRLPGSGSDTTTTASGAEEGSGNGTSLVRRRSVEVSIRKLVTTTWSIDYAGSEKNGINDTSASGGAIGGTLERQLRGSNAHDVCKFQRGDKASDAVLYLNAPSSPRRSSQDDTFRGGGENSGPSQRPLKDAQCRRMMATSERGGGCATQLHLVRPSVARAIQRKHPRLYAAWERIQTSGSAAGAASGTAGPTRGCTGKATNLIVSVATGYRPTLVEPFVRSFLRTQLATEAELLNTDMPRRPAVATKMLLIVSHASDFDVHFRTPCSNNQSSGESGPRTSSRRGKKTTDGISGALAALASRLVVFADVDAIADAVGCGNATTVGGGGGGGRGRGDCKLRECHVLLQRFEWFLQLLQMDGNGAPSTPPSSTTPAWRKSLECVQQIMITDARDVVFQRDPFSALRDLVFSSAPSSHPRNHTPDDFLMFPVERFPLSEQRFFGNDPYRLNRIWMLKAFGAGAFNALIKTPATTPADDDRSAVPFPIICGGLMFGSKRAMLRFLAVYVETAVLLGGCSVNDQGLLQGLVGAGLGVSRYPYPVYAADSHCSPFTNQARTGMELTTSWNTSAATGVLEMTNCHGEAYAVLHQFDRFKSYWTAVQDANRCAAVGV